MRVVLGHSLHGPVDAVDVANSRLTLIGQPVHVTSSTAFDDSITGGLAGIVTGDIVEAHALYDPVGASFLATRLEKKSGSVPEYRFHGPIASLDPAAKTFALRGLTVWYGGTVEYRNGTEAMLANDRRVEVRGVLAADRQRIEARRIPFR